MADTNEQGQTTRQRWRHPKTTATIDFLMPPTRKGQKGGSLQDLEIDLAAVVTPGLRLAFRDRQIVRVEGQTLLNEHLGRDIPVCGPGAFVVLKALAFRRRGENKDAYDLVFVGGDAGRDRLGRALRGFDAAERTVDRDVRARCRLATEGRRAAHIGGDR